MLRLSNIETYYGPINAIKGISIGIDEGTIVTVLGPNGAGKSTMLKTISGILEPTKGSVEFMGEMLNGLDPDIVAKRGIAHIPEGREVFEELTVKENLLMGAFLRKGKNSIREDIIQMQSYFPILKARESQMAGTLSGGEQQMLAIARGLMLRPKLLLMDEPSLGLSPLMVGDIYEIIKRFKDEMNTTILVVEQNASMALSIASYAYILENGRVVLEGETDVIVANEDVKEFYLGIGSESVREEKRWKRRKKWR